MVVNDGRATGFSLKLHSLRRGAVREYHSVQVTPSRSVSAMLADGPQLPLA